MKTKKYCFRHSSFGEKLGTGFFSFFTNLGIPIVAFYVISIVMGLFGITEHFSVELMMVLLVISILLGLFFAMKFCFCFKGVILYNSCLEIVTQTLGFGKDKPKITICYSEIASVFVSSYNIRYNRKKARKSFISGDYTNYVELTLKDGKQYCFTVENQEDFVKEVVSRMKTGEDN